jgi:hypothetical protein
MKIQDVQANLPETSPFLPAQMALVSTFFQMFILLGMYNFEVKTNSSPLFTGMRKKGYT